MNEDCDFVENWPTRSLWLANSIPVQADDDVERVLCPEEG